MSRISGDKCAATPQSRGGNQQICVFGCKALFAPRRPQVGGQLQNIVRHGQKQRVPTERLKTDQLRRGILLEETAQVFVAV